MGFMTGFGGGVTWTIPDGGGVAGGVVLEVRRWGGDIRGDVLDGTSMLNTDGWRNKKIGLLGGAGTVEVNIEPGTTPPMVGGSNRAPALLTLECFDALEDVSITFSGSALLSGVQPTNEVAGIGLMTYAFEFTGPVTASKS